jgi:peptidoglycan/xylan/chitin deacetylase (PgdA/CDA1 family)
VDNDRYAYLPTPARENKSLPGGARLAFWVVLNVEHFLYEAPMSNAAAVGPVPDVPNIAVRDYGPRVGIWRLMRLMDRYHLPVTAALNSDVCAQYPQIVEAGTQRGWEWMGHGRTNSRKLVGLSPDDERSVIGEVTEVIHAATGQKPSGWLSPGLAETPSTLDILSENGYRYVADWCADDRPFALRATPRDLLSVPYSMEINDFSAFLLKGMTSEQFFQMVMDQFDALYEEGEENPAVMALPLHPYLAGQPFHMKWLNAALSHITSRGDVWFAQGKEIADWYDAAG